MADARTAVATDDRRVAFYGGRRWHVLSAFGFSVCGVFRGGATTITASEVPERDRCKGACRSSWPKATDAP